MPVIPATQEANTGESLEPRGRGCSKPISSHCTPPWAARANLHLKKKKKKDVRKGCKEEGIYVNSYLERWLIFCLCVSHIDIHIALMFWGLNFLETLLLLLSRDGVILTESFGFWSCLFRKTSKDRQ